MLKKGDFIIYGIIAAMFFGSLFITSFLRSDDGNTHRTAVIKQGEKEIERIDLDKVEAPYRLNVNGSYNEVVLVEKGRIRFVEANCPDQVCVRTGWLSRKGDTAVCIPNRTIIKIEGENIKVDGVTY